MAKEGIVSTMGVLAGLGDIGSYSGTMHSVLAAFFLQILQQYHFCSSTFSIHLVLLQSQPWQGNGLQKVLLVCDPFPEPDVLLCIADGIPDRRDIK